MAEKVCVKPQCLIAIARLVVLIDDFRRWQEHPKKNSIGKATVGQIIIELRRVEENCPLSKQRREIISNMRKMLEESPWSTARYIISPRLWLNEISVLLLELAQNQ